VDELVVPGRPPVLVGRHEARTRCVCPGKLAGLLGPYKGLEEATADMLAMGVLQSPRTRLPVRPPTPCRARRTRAAGGRSGSGWGTQEERPPRTAKPRADDRQLEARTSYRQLIGQIRRRCRDSGNRQPGFLSSRLWPISLIGWIFSLILSNAIWLFASTVEQHAPYYQSSEHAIFYLTLIVIQA
jgi:hypothetical protein